MARSGITNKCSNTGKKKTVSRKPKRAKTKKAQKAERVGKSH